SISAGSAHRCLGEGVLARRAQRREVLPDAQKGAACAGLDAGALLPDIRAAGFAHPRGPRQCRLAGFGKALKVCLDALSELTPSRLNGGTKLFGIPPASLRDRGILGGRGRCGEQYEHCNSQIKPAH
ncbi:MAG TPA: hypothetical protein VKE26_21110, partial [Xanthobacteraceae bacterium]|nr:hypothetical protein [Xanthobacteraceae bacterium]